MQKNQNKTNPTQKTRNHLICDSKDHYPDSMITPRTESLKQIQTARDKEEALLQTSSAKTLKAPL